MSCGTVIKQNDGSQDELVRLYNSLVSEHAPGITYSNFKRYLEEQDSEDFPGGEHDTEEGNTIFLIFVVGILLNVNLLNL